MPAITNWRRREAGLTLIELLISIVIGLLVVSALLVVYLGSRSAYRSSEALARVQEGGRFAIEFIASDARMAGFMGCRSRNLGGSNFTNRVPQEHLNDYAGTGDAVIGFANKNEWSAAWNSEIPGNYLRGHVITIRRTGDQDGVAIGSTVNTGSGGGAVTLKADLNLDPAGKKIAVVGDCAHTFVFRWESYDPGARTLTYNVDGPLAPVSPDWLGEARSLEQIAYYIGFPPAAAGASDAEKSLRPGLYRFVRGSTAPPQLLVEDVEEMEVVYGLDTVPAPPNADGVVDVYRRTSQITGETDPNVRRRLWQQALSARVSLLIVSPLDNTRGGLERAAATTDKQKYAFRDQNGDGALDQETAPDNRLRHVFTTTISLRNKVQ